MSNFLGSQCVVNVNERDRSVTLQADDNDSGRKFTYDYVYGQQSTQQQVYDEAAFQLVESVLEGYNGKKYFFTFQLILVNSDHFFAVCLGTMFAYGQTGCGKSHTMMGVANAVDENG